MQTTGELAIRATDITKTFSRYGHRATSLKERLIRRDRSAVTFAALNRVSLDVARGQTVGLIGRNGSGKSTFLKVLAGIIRPTSGTVVTNGRVASLLELGAGFNGELTGRENIYLNASLLGLRRAETDALYDSIVDFSELAEFIDTPVKHYSSGMYVRLGFAVAVHVDPDILLIDEVLAVGDEAFAHKCLATIASFQSEGRTILMVSHDLDLVEKMSDHVVVLEHGNVMFSGDPAFATGTLRGILGTDGPLPTSHTSTPGVLFRDIVVSSEIGGPPVAKFRGGDQVCVRVVVDVRADLVPSCQVLSAVVMGAGGIPIWVMEATRDDSRPTVGSLPAAPGTWVADFSARLPMIEGSFRIAVQLATVDGAPVAADEDAKLFTVRSGQRAGVLLVDYDTECHLAEGLGSDKHGLEEAARDHGRE